MSGAFFFFCLTEKGKKSSQGKKLYRTAAGKCLPFPQVTRLQVGGLKSTLAPQTLSRGSEAAAFPLNAAQRRCPPALRRAPHDLPQTCAAIGKRASAEPVLAPQHRVGGCEGVEGWGRDPSFKLKVPPFPVAAVPVPGALSTRASPCSAER